MMNKSWISFLEEIDKAKSTLSLKGTEECFYRGHTNIRHELLPGLLRKHSKKIDRYSLEQIESDLFYEFRSRAKEVHSGNLNDWDILFYMQHHGVKTRLLDWSESLGVAIYFALLNYEASTSTPCIWLLNPYKLNGIYSKWHGMIDPESLDSANDIYDYSYSDYISFDPDAEKISWKKPIALYPIRRLERLTKQGGYFTIHGTDSRPIEKMIPASKNVWKQIPLPKEAVNEALKFLEYAGINHFTLFPDLDGLATYLNKKYFL